MRCYYVLQESGEMYLETIYILAQKSPYVRSIDVAEYMGFSKPSVSRGMGLLKQGGYLTSDEDGYLTLTELGRQTAEKIYERHTVIRDMLIHLGVGQILPRREITRYPKCRYHFFAFVKHLIASKLCGLKSCSIAQASADAISRGTPNPSSSSCIVWWR